jgi:hypothetical protein
MLLVGDFFWADESGSSQGHLCRQLLSGSSRHRAEVRKWEITAVAGTRGVAWRLPCVDGRKSWGSFLGEKSEWRSVRIVEWLEWDAGCTKQQVLVMSDS